MLYDGHSDLLKKTSLTGRNDKEKICTEKHQLVCLIFQERLEDLPHGENRLAKLNIHIKNAFFNHKKKERKISMLFIFYLNKNENRKFQNISFDISF